MILLYNPHVDSIHIGFKSVFTNMRYIIYLYLDPFDHHRESHCESLCHSSSRLEACDRQLGEMEFSVI